MRALVRTAGMVLAAIAVFILIGGAVYFGLDAIGRIPATTRTPAGTLTESAAATSASATKAANPGQSGNELMQQLIDMILNDGRFDELYDRIPDVHRPGVDKDTFYQYVSLLRKGIRGKITSFIPMQAKEIAEVRSEILENSPGYNYLTDILSGYWINYQTVSGGQERFAAYLHQQADGMYVFSKDWIDGVLSLQSYATLYFDAVEKGNVDALSVLVFSEINDSGVREAKANAIIRFYQKSVSVKSSGFRLLYARADSFAFEQGNVDYGASLTYVPTQAETPFPASTPTPALPGQPLLATPTPLPAPQTGTTRIVRVIKSGLDQVKVDDPIPYNLSYDDVAVRKEGETVLALGDYVFSFELNTRFGQRLSYEYFDVMDLSGNTYQIIVAQYPGVTITLIGSCDDRLQAFQGHVYGIEFHTGSYRTGADLSIGALRKAVLMRYPFMDLTQWSASTPSTFDRIDLTILNGSVSGIRITRQAESLADAIARAALITPPTDPASGEVATP